MKVQMAGCDPGVQGITLFFTRSLQGENRDLVFFFRANVSSELHGDQQLDLASELSTRSVLFPRFCNVNVPWEMFNCLEK